MSRAGIMDADEVLKVRQDKTSQKVGYVVLVFIKSVPADARTQDSAQLGGELLMSSAQTCRTGTRETISHFQVYNQRFKKSHKNN